MRELAARLVRALEYLERPGFFSRSLWYIWKMALALGVMGVVYTCYFNASAFTAHRSYDLTTFIDRAIPFVEWSWWFYFPGYLAGLIFSVCAYRNTRKYYKTLVAILIAQTICTIGFLILPSTFPRPAEASAGFNGDVIRWFWTIDPPNNTFPSKHVSIAILSALGLWEDDDNILRYGSALFALGVVITVHTTKQHYIVDTIGGALVALFSWWVVFRWWPRRREAGRTTGR